MPCTAVQAVMHAHTAKQCNPAPLHMLQYPPGCSFCHPPWVPVKYYWQRLQTCSTQHKMVCKSTALQCNSPLNATAACCRCTAAITIDTHAEFHTAMNVPLLANPSQYLVQVGFSKPAQHVQIISMHSGCYCGTDTQPHSHRHHTG